MSTNINSPPAPTSTPTQPNEPARGYERYAAYFARARQFKIAIYKSALAAKRYLAYSSDIGESMRPVVMPKWVTISYGVAWTYILGDCFYKGYSDYSSE